MKISGAKYFLAGGVMTAMLAGCAASQQAMKPATPTVVEGRYVRIELHDGTNFPVEKVDRLYERVAGLLGVNPRNGGPRPTIVVATPEVIRQYVVAYGQEQLLDGFAPVGGYVGGRVLTYGYDASRLGRLLAYHFASQDLKVGRAEADRLAARVENRITWEAANPFNTKF